jgi:hypothetical protein
MKINSMPVMVALVMLPLSLISCSKNSSSSTDPDPTPGPPAENVRQPTFQFSTTNWDDGWVSNIKEDWVEVTKGDVKVLLHYPQASTNIAADPEPYVNNAWNILVSKRYNNLV